MPTSTRRPGYALILIAALLALPAVAIEPDEAAPENWPQFRGPNGMPVSSNPDLPTTWSTTDKATRSTWLSMTPASTPRGLNTSP